MANVKKLKRKAKRNKLGIFFFLILAAGFVYFLNQQKTSPQIKSPVAETPAPTIKPSATPSHNTKPDPNIQKTLQDEVEKLPGTYNIVIKDLKKNKTYSLNASDKIPSASIYKLAVLYKTYDSLEKGELKKDQILSSDLDVEKALNLMITISDNTSALLLANRLGWANINSFLLGQGINGFNLNIKDYPVTTAIAVSDLLEKIYNKTAVSKTSSEEMLNLLLGQQINDRIPKYLPKDVKIAHKTGELDNFRHDVGIIFGKKDDYIFVFLTETPRPEDAYENIANLTKTMFNILESS